MNKIAFKGGALLNPVPCVLVTSKYEDKINVLTIAWAGTICTIPPMVSISLRKERYSFPIISEAKEFVINIPSTDQSFNVDFCGVKSGKDMDKIKNCGFNLGYETEFNTPYITDSPVNLLCRVKDILPLGSHHMFLAEVIKVLVDESLMDSNGKIHLDKANLLCYNHGEYFGLGKKPLGKFGFSVKKK